MPEVTSHAPGTPSWFELTTIDENGALEFYSAIFGWVDDPQPIGENWLYHMQKLNGLEAAAIFQQQQEERSQGVPSHWNTYFTVTNVDESVAKVQQAGGTVLFGPMDVFTARSEEHTSELQSRTNLVCRLLLEKKKKKKKKKNHKHKET